MSFPPARASAHSINYQELATTIAKFDAYLEQRRFAGRQERVKGPEAQPAEEEQHERQVDFNDQALAEPLALDASRHSKGDEDHQHDGNVEGEEHESGNFDLCDEEEAEDYDVASTEDYDDCLYDSESESDGEEWHSEQGIAPVELEPAATTQPTSTESPSGPSQVSSEDSHAVVSTPLREDKSYDQYCNIDFEAVFDRAPDFHHTAAPTLTTTKTTETTTRKTATGMVITTTTTTTITVTTPNPS